MPVPDSHEPDARHGALGVWFIYADFLESSAPPSWPDSPEFNGGILAYFSIHWQINDDGSIKIVRAENETPPTASGVDWQTWLPSTKNGG